MGLNFNKCTTSCRYRHNNSNKKLLFVKKMQMFKTKKIILIFLCVGSQLVAQNLEKKWTIAASVGVAKFSSIDARATGDQFVVQIPKLNMSRYLSKGVTLDVGFSAGVIDRVSGVFDNSTDYFSMDIGSRYDFRQSNQNLVPYLFAGTSFVNVNKEFTPTLNIGGGAVFWLSSKYGVQPQLLYKTVQTSAIHMRSHVYFSIGFVYSLKHRILVPRLWGVTNG